MFGVIDQSTFDFLAKLAGLLGGPGALTVAYIAYKYLKGLRDDVTGTEKKSAARHRESMEAHRELGNSLVVLENNQEEMSATVTTLVSDTNKLQVGQQQAMAELQQVETAIRGDLNLGAQRMATLEKGQSGNASRLGKHSEKLDTAFNDIAIIKTKIERA